MRAATTSARGSVCGSSSPTEGAGRWRESSGEKSKFGLFVTEILELFRTLKEHGLEDCLQLVHCHPGSQLQDIRRVKDAVNELAHVYAELKLMGAGLRYIDIGGGLGVDYDGSRTNYPSSMNYTLAEYASDVVYRIANVCNARGIEHPVIVSESGRAIAAHHSLLVFNTLGCSRLDRFRVDEKAEQDFAGGDRVPQPVRDIFDAYRSISERRLVECYHDALQAREQALQMFNLGYLGLEARAHVERLYWATCAKIRDCCRRLESVPEELEGLESVLSDIYFCNVSVFQSLPDSWAIDQLFPIMPVHRLDERPTRNAVLADITCDSDGKIDRFVSLREAKRTLELHELSDGEPYFLAAFLVGAYQETLGDLHNLFGDTHVVHIKLHDEGGWWIEETVKGDTAAEVLRYMQLRRRPSLPAARARLRACGAGRPPVTRGEPGAAPVLRAGAERLHLSRARLTRPPHGPEGTTRNLRYRVSGGARRQDPARNRAVRRESCEQRLAGVHCRLPRARLGQRAGCPRGQPAFAAGQHPLPVAGRRGWLHRDRPLDALGHAARLTPRARSFCGASTIYLRACRGLSSLVAYQIDASAGRPAGRTSPIPVRENKAYVGSL